MRFCYERWVMNNAGIFVTSCGSFLCVDISILPSNAAGNFKCHTITTLSELYSLRSTRSVS